MSSSEAALNKQKEDQEAQDLDIGEFVLDIKPRCLTFEPKAYHKPAAYTSDGFMLPCCWLDDPKNDFGVEYFGLKDEHLRVNKAESIEAIFKSEEWDHFFHTLLHDQKHAMKHCKYKCGNLRKDNNLYLTETI
jgi:hypothetical protein|tara:strand:- start:161 stop:559 length:399 start_codon:yes stop_codon:yes gene_type:complete